MKSLKQLLIISIYSIIIISCADNKQNVSRRGESKASLDAQVASLPSPTNNDFKTESSATLSFAAPSLVEAKNNASLTAEFRANILLLSKISNTQLIIYGKDGRSWLYNPSEGAAPLLQQAVVVKPVGYSLFTLPEGQFWLVGLNSLGRRKAGDSVLGAVPVENFDTTSIKGDWSKVKVLYAAPEQIILHLDSNIAILAIKDGKPVLSQFSSSIPVQFDSAIVAAGETEAKGYWFSSKDTFAVLDIKATQSVWSKIKVPLSGHEDYTSIGLWLDSSKREVLGDALVLQADKFWSVSGAAIQ